MTNAVQVADAAFAPQNPFAAAGSRFFAGGMEFSLFCKDILQGLFSALMLIVGSGHMMAGDATVALPIGLDGAFFDSLFTGRMMGALEIGVAALLFLSTRRGVARTLGVLALLAYIALHNSGVSVGDLTASASAALRDAADALDMSQFAGA